MTGLTAALARGFMLGCVAHTSLLSNTVWKVENRGNKVHIIVTEGGAYGFLSVCNFFLHFNWSTGGESSSVMTLLFKSKEGQICDVWSTLCVAQIPASIAVLISWAWTGLFIPWIDWKHFLLARHYYCANFIKSLPGCFVRGDTTFQSILFIHLVSVRRDTALSGQLRFFFSPIIP